MNNDDWNKWVRADEVLAFVLPGAANEERERIARARKAGNALPEAAYVVACQDAGVPVWWQLPPESRPMEAPMAWLPTWAAPLLEATILRGAQQAAVLRYAARNEDFREAAMSVWRLGGLDALVAWLNAPEPPRRLAEWGRWLHDKGHRGAPGG